MANADIAFGLTPVKGAFGSAWNGETIECVALSSYATALFIGDPVILAGSGDTSGRPSIQIAVGSAGTASPNIFGVITGIKASGPDGGLLTNRGSASTTRIIEVVPAFSNVFFEVNCDASIDVDGIGNGYDLLAGAGSTTTGRSGWELDVSTVSTLGRQTRIVGLKNSPNNDIGESGSGQTGTIAIVSIVESIWNNGAGV